MASVKRPTSVRVFGKTFALQYVPHEVLTDAVGVTYAMRQLIYIADEQTPVEEADTVLHELLHAIARVGNLGLSMDLEERAVTVLASGLIGVFQDNPDFAKWVTRRLPSPTPPAYPTQ